MLSLVSSRPNNSLLSYHIAPTTRLFSKCNSFNKPYNFISSFQSPKANFARFFSKSNQANDTIADENNINPDQHYALGLQYANQKDLDNAAFHFKAGAEKNHTDCMNAFGK